MFLNYIKNFFTKKTVKKRLSNVGISDADHKVKSIGIVFEERYLDQKQPFVQELVRNGIDENQINILVFKNKIKKNDSFDDPVFSARDLSWAATFDQSQVKDFIALPFDLLISYYDTEKSALLLATNLSKAKFKVGFSAVDKKLNHLMIDTAADDYKVFAQELFKYLKILNKI